jgi:hypothetical protein
MQNPDQASAGKKGNAVEVLSGEYRLSAKK